MEKTAIIAEFNPLHNGHRYIIDKAREYGDVVIVMSGGLVQRGDIALLDKYERAEHAVSAGADLVVELPPPFAFCSAQYFAAGAIRCAAACGATRLVFGSESGETPEPLPENSSAMKDALKSGVSYSKAIAEATRTLGPNDILAAEYAKAAARFAPRTVLTPIKRIGAAHGDAAPSDGFCSSASIRASLERISDFKDYAPDFVLRSLYEKPCANPDERFFSVLKFVCSNGVENIFGMSEGLDRRFEKCLAKADCYGDFLAALKTKRYTMARLKRLCLFAATGLDKPLFESLDAPPEYINVLAVKRGKTRLLKEIELQKLTKPSDAADCAAFEYQKKCDALFEAVRGNFLRQARIYAPES